MSKENTNILKETEFILNKNKCFIIQLDRRDRTELLAFPSRQRFSFLTRAQTHQYRMITEEPRDRRNNPDSLFSHIYDIQ